MEVSFPGIRKMGQCRSRVPVWVCDPRELCTSRQPGKGAGGHRSLELRRETWAGAVDPRLMRFGHIYEGLMGRL